jgi:DNA-directed RNA polymerase sigma subunit (sigma70/sigma32)
VTEDTPEARLLRAFFPPHVLPSRAQAERAEREAMQQAIADVFERLPRRERMALVRRFGMGADPRPASLQDIAAEFGITRLEADALVTRALARVRRLEHGNDHP